MPEKTSMSNSNPEIEVNLKELEDEQLRDILKKRKLYQDYVAKAAVKEAINRDIIATEDDLYAPEFRHEPLKPRLFPKIENPVNRNNIRRSVARGLLLAGLLPSIWGMVRLNTGFSSEGMMLMVFGLTWMGFSAWLIRTYSVVAVRSLFVLLVLSVVYVIRRMLMIPQIVFMDLFIVIVLYFLIVYGLLFIIWLRD